ncbi:MAG: hypothetical protein GY933_06420, partial [Hyphomicrobiales bacterium]|nr:hypothetical protein [Hyphomicrobiales bacterium]
WAAEAEREKPDGYPHIARFNERVADLQDEQLQKDVQEYMEKYGEPPPSVYWDPFAADAFEPQEFKPQQFKDQQFRFPHVPTGPSPGAIVRPTPPPPIHIPHPD